MQNSDSEHFANRAGVISFSFKNVPHNLAAKELARYGGIGVRNGCFCAHLLVKQLLKIHPSRAKAADIGLLMFPKTIGTILPGLVRISFGLQNDIHEAIRLILCIEKITKEPRSQKIKLAAKTNNGTLFIPKNDVDRKIDHFIKSREELVFG